MEVYNWVIMGGVVQIGFVGEVLLIVYWDGFVGQLQLLVIDLFVVDLFVVYFFMGIWQIECGKLNFVQYIVGNQCYVVGDFVGQGVIVGCVIGNCVSGIFIDDVVYCYGVFCFCFEGSELDGEWCWLNSFVINSWDGSYGGEEIILM